MLEINAKKISRYSWKFPRQLNGENRVFSKNGSITVYLFKKERCLLLNLKWIIDLCVKAKTITLLQDNLGENLCKHEVSINFLGHKNYEKKLKNN